MLFEEAVALVEDATHPEAVFGVHTRTQQREKYRMLSRRLHPDAVADGLKDRATAAFAKLSTLWDELLVSHGEKPAIKQVVISTKRRTYAVGKVVGRGDIANIYEARYVEDGAEMLCALKMPRHPRDSDLVLAEASALKRLAQRNEKFLADKADGTTFQPYFPEFVEQFRHRDVADRSERQVVASYLYGESWYTLQQVMDAYPHGLDAKDLAWMWRRVLIALGFAHRCGVVHGAVTPSHIMIEPTIHGVALVDWCYSTIDGVGKVPALAPGWEDLYPPEVRAKETPTPATDIYMVSKSMGQLLERDAPSQFYSFIRGCTLESQVKRPQDAWELQWEYDDLLERLWGKRRFRAFHMPPVH